MKKLWIDTETSSKQSIKQIDAYYRDCFVSVFVYAFEDEEAKIWDCINDPKMPSDLIHYFFRDDIIFIAHNMQFDRNVINNDINIQKQAIKIPAEKTLCTYIQACEHQLPGSLDSLGKLFSTSHKKLDTGKNLIRKFCNFDEPTKLKEYIENHKEDWEAFKIYALEDVNTLREIGKRMPVSNYPGRLFWEGKPSQEYRYWIMDTHTQERGFLIDVPMAEKALEFEQLEKEEIKEKVNRLTNGIVDSPQQVKKLKDYINDNFNINLESLGKNYLADLIAHTKDEKLKELLNIRLNGARTATAKYKAALEHAVDGVLRYQLKFAGASETLRYSARGFQPQNVKRLEYKISYIKEARRQLMKGALSSTYGEESLNLLSNMAGLLIKARPGYKIIAGDYSAMETRLLNYLAGNQRILSFYKQFDAGLVDYDVYQLAFSEAFGIPPQEVTKEQRQIGKRMELFLQYGGGCSAYASTIIIYNKNIDEEAAMIFELLQKHHPGLYEEALEEYKYASNFGFTGGLSKHNFAVFSALKKAWRNTRPETVSWWKLLEDGFKSALLQPDVTFYARSVAFRRTRNYIRMKLPSGIYLYFYNPQIRTVTSKDKKETREEIICRTYKNTEKSFITGKIYGGILAAKATQSTARGVLMHAYENLQNAGYEMLFTKHDEAVCEMPLKSGLSVENFKEVFTKMPSWLPDFSIKASCSVGSRYEKD